MRRFIGNRWFAFVLALGLLFASSASFPAPSMGDSGMDPIAIGDGGGGDPGTKGDPDGPSGPSIRQTPSHRTPTRVFVANTAGDGVGAVRGWFGRVRLLVRSWISRWTQF